MIGMYKTIDRETTVFYYYHHTQEEVDPAFRDIGSQIFLLVFVKLCCVYRCRGLQELGYRSTEHAKKKE